jgi:SAM-dependent methyltransferase
LVQIKEAVGRLSKLNAEQPRLKAVFSADFVTTQDIGDNVWLDDRGPYDAVTCMFALHYFFHSEPSARNAIEMAARNLKPGGHFFGVLPDGKNVQEACKNGNKMQPRIERAMRLVPRWSGIPQSFGSAYTCALTDTVTEVRSLPVPCGDGACAKAVHSPGECCAPQDFAPTITGFAGTVELRGNASGLVPWHVHPFLDT